MHTAAPAPMSMLTDVFDKIERERHWEPTFPVRYLLGDKPKLPHMPAEISLSGTAITDAPTLSRSTPGADPQSIMETDAKKLTQVRNLQYNEDAFAPFKAMGIRSLNVREALKARNVTPRNIGSAYHTTCWASVTHDAATQVTTLHTHLRKTTTSRHGALSTTNSNDAVARDPVSRSPP